MTSAPSPAPRAGAGDAAFRVCFVCTGNICRSPMADVVFTELVRRAGLAGRVVVDSAGTGDWHVGNPADERTIVTLAARGYEGERHRARRFQPEWFERLDLVIALDRSHERILRSWAPNALERSKVRLLLDFDREAGGRDVPDPYYADLPTFERVLGMIEHACHALLHQLEPALRAESADSHPLGAQPTKGRP